MLGGGFGGKSFKFDNSEKSRQQEERDAMKSKLKIGGDEESKKQAKEDLEVAFALKAQEEVPRGGVWILNARDSLKHHPKRRTQPKKLSRGLDALKALNHIPFP